MSNLENIYTFSIYILNIIKFFTNKYIYKKKINIFYFSN